MSSTPTPSRRVTSVQVVLSPDQRHEAMLLHVFQYAGLKSLGTPAELVVTQCLKCKEAMAQGIQVRGGALGVFLQRRGWYDVEPIRELFAAYVQAGFIQLNIPTPLVALPLEVAILRQHLEVLQACLDNGADERLVPSSDALRSRPEFPEDDSTEDGPRVLIRDVYDLVDNEVSALGTAPAMAAALREHAMQRRIRELSPPEAGRIGVGPADPSSSSSNSPAAPSAPRTRRAQL